MLRLICSTWRTRRSPTPWRRPRCCSTRTSGSTCDWPCWIWSLAGCLPELGRTARSTSYPWAGAMRAQRRRLASEWLRTCGTTATWTSSRSASGPATAALRTLSRRGRASRTTTPICCRTSGDWPLGARSIRGWTTSGATTSPSCWSPGARSRGGRPPTGEACLERSRPAPPTSCCLVRPSSLGEWTSPQTTASTKGSAYGSSTCGTSSSTRGSSQTPAVDATGRRRRGGTCARSPG
mmetsp:Transcript_5953/g.17826  ORF Transcript_5953/g.17826 Transcript_5953/m.17826 type:complete len:237 (+) Transcript_5953:67-777(+)